VLQTYSSKKEHKFGIYVMYLSEMQHFNFVLMRSPFVKYLKLYLDRRLTWLKHFFVKQEPLEVDRTKMYWLLRCKSKLSTSNKLHIFKAILKPMRTYGTQLWVTASSCSREILECFQTESFVHDSGRPLVHAEYVYPKISPNTNS
jgi:hypothetical protein